MPWALLGQLICSIWLWLKRPYRSSKCMCFVCRTWFHFHSYAWIAYITKGFPNKCPSQASCLNTADSKVRKKFNSTSFLLKHLWWLSSHSYLCFLYFPPPVALKCAYDWKCITQGTCSRVKLVRISWSHPISASIRQGGENVQLWADPYFLLFLRQSLERKVSVVVVVPPAKLFCWRLAWNLLEYVLKNTLLGWGRWCSSFLKKKHIWYQNVFD